MSVKMMIIGTGVMFVAIAGMAANRISGGAPSQAVAKLRCGDSYGASVDGVADGLVCGADAGLQWIYAMGGVFFIGVIINVYGRIKAAQARS